MKFVIALCILGFVASSPLPGDPIDGLLPVVAQIKGILSTNYGFNQLKAYLLNIPSDDELAQKIRLAIAGTWDEDLKEIVHAFFEKVPILAIEPGFEYPTLTTLFGEVKHMLKSDQGIQAVREYLEVLDSPNEAVQEIVKDILLLDDQELKHCIDVIFSGIKEVFLTSNYDIQKDLEKTVGILKAIALNPAGIQKVRDIMNNIKSTDPTVVLAKTVLSSMSDASLIDLGNEAGKNIPEVSVGEPLPDLLDTLRIAKNLMITDDGIKYLRQYFNDLKTGNFLIVKVKKVLKERTDQELKEHVSAGWKEIFGEDPFLTDLIYPEMY